MKGSPCPVCQSPMVGENACLDGTLVECSAYCPTCGLFSDEWREGSYISVIVGVKEYMNYETATNDAVTECRRLLETHWPEFYQMWQRVIHWRTGIFHNDQDSLTAMGVLADWLEERDYPIFVIGARKWIEEVRAENEIEIKEFFPNEGLFRV